jgi:hypothetical protein
MLKYQQGFNIRIFLVHHDSGWRSGG